MLLRLDRRTLVDQQVAEVDVGVAEVVAEDALAEILEEDLPGRRLAIELARLGGRGSRRRCSPRRHRPSARRRRAAAGSCRSSPGSRRSAWRRRPGSAGRDRRSRRPRRSASSDSMSEMPRESASAQSGVRKPKPPDRAHEARAPLRRRRPRRADVGADRSILGDVAGEAVADLDLEALARRSGRAAPWSARLSRSTIATTLSSLWNGMATVGALTSRGITGRPPR